MNISSVSAGAQSFRAPEVENDGDADDKGAKAAKAPAPKAQVSAAPQAGETFSILA
jgi:hypothetical protein